MFRVNLNIDPGELPAAQSNIQLVSLTNVNARVRRQVCPRHNHVGRLDDAEPCCSFFMNLVENELES